MRMFMHKNPQTYADAATFLHSSYRDSNEKEGKNLRSEEEEEKLPSLAFTNGKQIEDPFRWKSSLGASFSIWN